jgi:hypothetical protein
LQLTFSRAHAIGLSGAGPEEVVRHMLGRFPIHMRCTDQI